MPDRQFAFPPQPARAPVAQSYDHERTETSVWLWLGIGVVLGIGATLLSSSLWLPESGDVDLVELEASEDAIKSSGVASVNEATERRQPLQGNTGAPALSVAEAAIIAEPASPEPASTTTIEVSSPPPSDGDNPSQTETQLVALDVVDAVVPPPVNGVDESDAAEPAAKPEPASDRELADQSDTPRQPLSATTERLLPADDADVKGDDDAEAANAGDSAADEVDPGSSDIEIALAPPATTPEEPEVSQPLASETVVEESAALTPVEAEPRASDAAGSGGRDTAGGTELAAVTPAVANGSSPPISTDRRASGRLYRVQLAAVANEAAARVFWREANERLPNVFKGVEPVYDERIVDQRLYLRIWVGSFGLRREADSYCAWLKEQGQDCFVTRVDNL
jgi:hypothetical protein